MCGDCIAAKAGSGANQWCEDCIADAADEDVAAASESELEEGEIRGG